ncbi:collagen alpha-1(I) chain-like [Phyllostomus discolor]|uniref:Collagen alpha-1(I) chain-like n=1 Tax=Phyllostomus discolor TaxID=89673 RepID=A0A6J2N3Z1_9CHIR|nr:collagen alpha-1(I) chain-like [Phyllostomus discolor]
MGGLEQPPTSQSRGPTRSPKVSDTELPSSKSGNSPTNRPGITCNTGSRSLQGPPRELLRKQEMMKGLADGTVRYQGKGQRQCLPIAEPESAPDSKGKAFRMARKPQHPAAAGDVCGPETGVLLQLLSQGLTADMPSGLPPSREAEAEAKAKAKAKAQCSDSAGNRTGPREEDAANLRAWAAAENLTPKEGRSEPEGRRPLRVLLQRGIRRGGGSGTTSPGATRGKLGNSPARRATSPPRATFHLFSENEPRRLRFHRAGERGRVSELDPGARAPRTPQAAPLLAPRGSPFTKGQSRPSGSPDTTRRGPSARPTRTSETRSAGTGYSPRARGDYRGRSLAARRPALPIGSDSARAGLRAKAAGPAGNAGAVGLRSGGRPAAEGARRSSSSAAAVRVLLELRRLFPGSGSAAPAPDAAARRPGGSAPRPRRQLSLAAACRPPRPRPAIGRWLRLSWRLRGSVRSWCAVPRPPCSGAARTLGARAPSQEVAEVSRGVQLTWARLLGKPSSSGLLRLSGMEKRTPEAGSESPPAQSRPRPGLHSEVGRIAPS